LFFLKPSSLNARASTRAEIVRHAVLQGWMRHDP